MSTVAIIDYGMGNLHSISKALQHVADDATVRVSNRPDEILSADRVVFPGVGAIRDCMSELLTRGLDDVVREAAARRPFLGICLGMQAMLDESEENNGIRCLGLVPGQVRYFGDKLVDGVTGERLKNPHMGWNRIDPTRSHPLWNGIEPGNWFYFVHSYYVDTASADDCAATTDYSRPFASAIGRDNVFAVQCHPEKSHRSGLALLRNFMNWDGQA